MATPNSAREWFESLPVVTKYFILLSGVLPLVMKFNILPPSLLVWHLPAITKRFEYCSQLETGHFNHKSADFLYFILICGVLLNAINCYFKMAGMWENMSMVLIYLWAQKNRTTPVSFFFGIRFPAMYLPVVVAAFDFITDGNALGTLCGIVVGHFWFVLSEVYGLRNPRIHRLLEAPQFLKKFIDKPAYKPVPSSAKPSQAQEPFVSFSGKGRKLGGG